MTPAEINPLPQITFDKKIVVVKEKNHLDVAIKKLEKNSLLGFDTEQKPCFKKGEKSQITVIQLATYSEAYIFQIKNTGLTKSMIGLLANPRVKKIGVNVNSDVRKLQKIKHFEPAQFFDLKILSQKLSLSFYSLRRLTAYFLHKRLSKKQQLSNWERNNLTSSQKIYAATDAWIALLLYQEMNKKINEKKEKNLPIKTL